MHHRLQQGVRQTCGNYRCSVRLSGSCFSISGLCIVVSCSSKRTTKLSAFELLDVSPRYIPAYRVTDEIKDRAAKTLMFKDETVARALLDHYGVPFDPSMTASGYPITIFLD